MSSSEPTPSLESEVTDLIRSELAQGFRAREEIASYVGDMLGDVHDAAEVVAAAERLLPGLVAEREAEMAGWPAVTDCDRLDAAFEELNARGIMARHNWWCCGNCGCDVMPDERKRLRGKWQGVPIVGYAFYHAQDTECAAAGGGIYLNFGSCEQTRKRARYEAKSLEVGRTIVEVISKHGLSVAWDGTHGQRPRVEMEWRRRARPARFCEGDGAKEGVWSGLGRLLGKLGR